MRAGHVIRAGHKGIAVKTPLPPLELRSTPDPSGTAQQQAGGRGQPEKED